MRRPVLMAGALYVALGLVLLAERALGGSVAALAMGVVFLSVGIGLLAAEGTHGYRAWVHDVPEGVARRDWRLHPIAFHRSLATMTDQRYALRALVRAWLGLGPPRTRFRSMPWGHRGPYDLPLTLHYARGGVAPIRWITHDLDETRVAAMLRLDPPGSIILPIDPEETP